VAGILLALAGVVAVTLVLVSGLANEGKKLRLLIPRAGAAPASWLVAGGIAAVLVLSTFVAVSIVGLSQTNVQQAVMLRDTETRLVNFYSTGPVLQLFSEALDNPTQQNLTALSEAMALHDKIVLALLTLNKAQLSSAKWEAVTNPQYSPGKGAVFVLNLESKPQLDKTDLRIMEELERAWVAFDNAMSRHLRLTAVESPDGLAQAYLGLIEDTEEAVGPH